MKYVRLHKIAALENPSAAPGNPKNYPYGCQCLSGHSLPLQYMLEGWVVSRPVVGERFELLRCVRNGVVSPGLFRSTVVTDVTTEEFQTLNSVYRISEIQFATEAQRMIAEGHPYFTRPN